MLTFLNSCHSLAWKCGWYCVQSRGGRTCEVSYEASTNNQKCLVRFESKTYSMEANSNKTQSLESYSNGIWHKDSPQVSLMDPPQSNTHHLKFDWSFLGHPPCMSANSSAHNFTRSRPFRLSLTVESWLLAISLDMFQLSPITSGKKGRSDNKNNKRNRQNTDQVRLCTQFSGFDRKRKDLLQ